MWRPRDRGRARDGSPRPARARRTRGAGRRAAGRTGCTAPASSSRGRRPRRSGRRRRPRAPSAASVFASGLFQFVGPPDHSVSSLRASRSRSGSPNTIAPRRPLPIGSASTHVAAGFSYQRRSGVSAAAADAEARARRGRSGRRGRVMGGRVAGLGCGRLRLLLQGAMSFPRPLAALVLPALVLVSNAACRGASPPDTDWAHYGGSPALDRFSPLARSRRRTSPRLKVAWTYDTGDAFPGRRCSASRSSRAASSTRRRRSCASSPSTPRPASPCGRSTRARGRSTSPPARASAASCTASGAKTGGSTSRRGTGSTRSTPGRAGRSPPSGGTAGSTCARGSPAATRARSRSASTPPASSSGTC